MTGPDSELSRLIRLDAIGVEHAEHPICATADECAALAVRFSLEAVESLGADVKLSRTHRGYCARGTLHAQVTQTCVATGESLPATIRTPLDILFVAVDAPTNDAEIILSTDDSDIMEHDGQQIDLGEAVAQTLLLALEPFPRRPDAGARLKAAGVVSDVDIRPFSALQTLKERLAKP